MLFCWNKQCPIALFIAQLYGVFQGRKKVENWHVFKIVKILLMIYYCVDIIDIIIKK